MARDDIRKELEEIRAQLDALQASRNTPDDAHRDAGRINPEASSATGSDVVEPENTVAADDGYDIAGQFQELVEVLDREIKESNPTTLLVVFALGVLVGRLLPR
ncbi:MAG: hypothetical protein U9R74_12445 [Pseudomonadota bacterium]|nr:hypothetical protein [Pseudomonadota bacterium]